MSLPNFPALEELNLTPEQQASWEAIKDTYTDGVRNAYRQYKEAVKRVQKEYNEALVMLLDAVEPATPAPAESEGDDDGE